MSRVGVVLFAVALLAAPGCGDDDDAASSAEPTGRGGTATTFETDGADHASGTEPGVGDLDCEALADAQFIVVDNAQILASLVSNAQFELVAEGVVDVDFVEIRAAITGLRPLADVETPIGSVATSLDRLERVASLAVEAASAPDPESTVAFAEIQPLIDDSAAFLGALGPVNYAFGEACQT